MNPLPFILLAISLPLLLGSVCNAELRTWTAVNGKELEAEFVSNEKGIVKLKLKSGKVFEVPANKLSKEDNEFIRSLAKPEGVNFNELETREGIKYLNGSDAPYTGKVFLFHENGQKMSEGNYKDGKGDGLWVHWHENGQKRSESNLKGGKANGLWLMWHKNGQKWIEEDYKDGKCEGLSVRWHGNGQKQVEGNFKDGELISAKFWNSKGEPVSSKEEAGLE